MSQNDTERHEQTMENDTTEEIEVTRFSRSSLDPEFGEDDYAGEEE